jgi:hypothetical protein
MPPMGEITHLGDLTSDPANLRRHTPRNVGMVEQALREVGAARSIVIDEDGVVLAGNATIDAAAAAGIERVQVVDADGNTIIAVRRTGLTAAQKTRLALFDNRATDLSDFDPALLAGLAADAPDLLDGLWRDDELAALLNTEPVDPAALWQGMPEYENEAQAARSLHVHFLTEADCVRFCTLLDVTITDATKTVWYPTAPPRDKYIFGSHES